MFPEAKPTSLQKKWSNKVIFSISKNTLMLYFSNPQFSPEVFTNFLNELKGKFKIHSHIKSLSLSFVGFCPLPEDLNKILLLIRSIKHLNKLHIKRFPRFTDYSLPHFLPFLQRALQLSKNLRKFELEIREPQFDLEKISLISRFISHIPSFAPKLTHFKLDYSSINGDTIEDIITSNFWPIIAKGLKKKISSLDIKLPISYLLNFDKLGNLNLSPLKNTRNLKELSLNLPNAHDYKLIGNGFQSIVPRKHFPNLRSFKISVNDFLLTKYLLSLTSRISSSLPKIQNISISLTYMRGLTEQEIVDLCSSLSEIKKLSHLSLILSHTVFTAQITSAFTSLLLSQKLRNLRDLTLNFTRCRSISDFSVKKIGESLAQNLVGLKRLSLSFGQFTGPKKQEGFVVEEMSNEGLIQLGNALVNKKEGFEKIKVVITGSSKVDDEGVKEFSDKVVLIENLKKIILVFTLCQNVTMDAQNYVKEKIGQVKREKEGKIMEIEKKF